MAGPTVVVSVLADTAKFKRDMDSVSSVGSRLNGTLGKIAKVGGAALLAVSLAVVGFLGASIRAAAEAEKIAAQTNAVIQSTQGVAGQTSASVDKLATSLSRISGIDDELIQKGANVLLTFTNIKGTNFDAATAAALDMSQALGTDLTQASRLVGRALNDPVAGLGALTRVGVQFTAGQKAQIAAMVEAGNTAGAQLIILDQLQTKFGGSAAAFGATFEGSLGRVKTSFENIQEAVGGAFLPTLTLVLGKVADLLNTVADSPAFQSIVTAIGTFVSGLVSGGAATSAFLDVFRVVMAVLSPFGLVLQALLPVLPSLQASFVGLGQALGGALLSVLPSLTTLLDAVVAALSGVLAAVLPVIIGLITQLAQIFAQLLPVVSPIITLLAGILTDALTTLIPIIAEIAGVLGEVLGAALTAVAPLLTMLAEFIGQVLESLSPLIPAVLSVVEAFLPLISALLPLISAILPPLAELLMAILGPILDLISPILDLLVPAITFLTDVLSGIIGVVVDVITTLVGLATGSEQAKQDVINTWQSVLAFFQGIPDAIAGFFAGAVDWLRQAGVNIVTGLLNGIRSMAGTIGSFFLNLLPGWIVGPFKAALGIASPSRVFVALGKTLPAGLVRGVTTGLDDIRAAAGSMAGAAVSGFGGLTPLSASAAAGAIAAGAIGGNHYVIQLPVGMPSAEAGRAIVAAIDEHERTTGGRR